MSDYYCLNDMKPEQTAKVLSLTCTGAARIGNYVSAAVAFAEAKSIFDCFSRPVPGVLIHSIFKSICPPCQRLSVFR